VSIDSAIGVLIVAVFATFLSFHAGKDAAEKGAKLTGVFLAAFVGFLAWALLSQGFDNPWPAAVGWVSFLAGAVEAVVTRKRG